MRVTRISVALEKRANDGDYGSEKSEVELFADMEPGDEAHTCLDWLMGTARMQIEHDLQQSANLKIRRSLIREVRRCNRCEQPLDDSEHGYMHPECKLAEDAEREARYQDLKRQRDEEERRDLEAIGTARDGDDDEDLPL